MPDRELRHMRRTELVEIILALKQSEDRLRAENPVFRNKDGLLPVGVEQVRPESTFAIC